MTPQQKKQLSYTRDCRNAYGENNKSSRKNIPRRRARKHRAYRHAIRQAVASNEDLDTLQSAIVEVRREGWQKVTDIPLIDHIKRQVEKRISSALQQAR